MLSISQRMAYEEEFFTKDEHEIFNGMTTLLGCVRVVISAESRRHFNKSQPEKSSLLFKLLDALTVICTRQREVMAIMVTRINVDSVHLVCAETFDENNNPSASSVSTSLIATRNPTPNSFETYKLYDSETRIPSLVPTIAEVKALSLHTHPLVNFARYNPIDFSKHVQYVTDLLKEVWRLQKTEDKEELELQEQSLIEYTLLCTGEKLYMRFRLGQVYTNFFHYLCHSPPQKVGKKIKNQSSPKPPMPASADMIEMPHGLMSTEKSDKELLSSLSPEQQQLPFYETPDHRRRFGNILSNCLANLDNTLVAFSEKIIGHKCNNTHFLEKLKTCLQNLPQDKNDPSQNQLTLELYQGLFKEFEESAMRLFNGLVELRLIRNHPAFENYLSWVAEGYELQKTTSKEKLVSFNLKEKIKSNPIAQPIPPSDPLSEPMRHDEGQYAEDEGDLDADDSCIPEELEELSETYSSDGVVEPKWPWAAAATRWIDLLLCQMEALLRLLPTYTPHKNLAPIIAGLDMKILAANPTRKERTMVSIKKLSDTVLKIRQDDRQLWEGWLQKANIKTENTNFGGSWHCEAILLSIYLLRLESEDVQNLSHVGEKVLSEFDNLVNVLAVGKRCCPICNILIGIVLQERKTWKKFDFAGYHSTYSGCSLPPWLPRRYAQAIYDEVKQELSTAVEQVIKLCRQPDLDHLSERSHTPDSDEGEKSGVGVIGKRSLVHDKRFANAKDYGSA